MAGSYNCLRLDNKYVFQVEVYEKENDNTKFFEIGDKKYLFKTVRVGQLTKLILHEGKFKDSDILNLWKINAKKYDLNLVSTKDGIEKLGGELMESEQSFVNYFPCVPDAENVNIHIVAVITNTTTELKRKRTITEEEETTEPKRTKWDTRKWDTNGAIRKVQRDAVYFVDPLPLSGPLLNKIRNGEFVALYGARASGKTTRVFRVMEKLEEEGYLCLYITLELINMDSKEKFWSSFGKYLIRTAPQHIKNHIKSADEFADLFSANEWEKKVVLFIDEYDVMYTANDETISSFLKVIRGIKARKEEFAIWSINAVGPFSILHLSSKEATTSPFNIKDPFQNPNFTQEQVQFLFKDYANETRIIINQEVIKDIYMRTNGHAGLVTNCGKAINEKLIKELDENFTLDISTWLKFTASNRLEGTILNYETFRKMIERFIETDTFRLTISFLRSSFAGFLGSIQINDSEEKKKADFLTAGGVLTVVNKDDNVYRMSSAFMDELIRRRIISDIYKSCPENAIPVKDDESLDILNILQMAIQFFDKTIISNGFTRSFKIADKLYVGGKKKKKVPRESVYDIELSRILVNWLVKGGGYEVTGQWQMVENRDGEKDKNSYSNIVITTDRQKIVLELLATATKKDLNEHFERVIKYAELISANEIWTVHFTCEDGYATQKLQSLQWPSDDRINVVHIFHDQKLNVLLMNAQYANSTGTIEYIVDQAVPLLS